MLNYYENTRDGLNNTDKLYIVVFLFIVFILSFKTFISSVYLSISLENRSKVRYFCDWICGFSAGGRPLVSSMNEKHITPRFHRHSLNLVLD